MVAIALLSDFGVEDGEELDLSGAWKLSLLSELAIGTVGVVESLDLPGEIQHHLMHMGFVPEARVMVVRRAPAGIRRCTRLTGLKWRCGVTRPGRFGFASTRSLIRDKQ